MSTFAAWLKEQAERQDATGHAARTWENITPGRISSVPGIQRYLEAEIESARTRGVSQGGIDSLKLALDGIKAAAVEYGDSRTGTDPVAGGIVRKLYEPGDELPEQVSAAVARTRPERVPKPAAGGGRVTSTPVTTGEPWLPEKLDALSERLDTMASGLTRGLTESGLNVNALAGELRQQAARLAAIERMLTALYELALGVPADPDRMALWLVDGEISFGALWSMYSNAAGTTGTCDR